MRYFNKTNKTEWLPPVGWDEILPANIAVLPPESIFWSAIPAGMLLDFDIDGLPILTAFAGSSEELAAAIALKQQEVREHYETLHGESLASVAKRQAAAAPSVVTTANAITNIGIADAGIIAIAALLNKAAVDAFSVAALSWV